MKHVVCYDITILYRRYLSCLCTRETCRYFTRLSAYHSPTDCDTKPRFLPDRLMVSRRSAREAVMNLSIVDTLI